MDKKMAYEVTCTSMCSPGEKATKYENEEMRCQSPSNTSNPR